MEDYNTLGMVRYADWDCLRGALYDIFGWYMKHLQQIERLADFEEATPDVFMVSLLDHGLEIYQERYDNIKRGDEL